MLFGKVSYANRWTSLDGGRYSIQRFTFRKPNRSSHPYWASPCKEYFTAYAVFDRSQVIGRWDTLEEAIDGCTKYKGALI